MIKINLLVLYKFLDFDRDTITHRGNTLTLIHKQLQYLKTRRQIRAS